MVRSVSEAESDVDKPIELDASKEHEPKRSQEDYDDYEHDSKKEAL